MLIDRKLGLGAVVEAKSLDRLNANFSTKNENRLRGRDWVEGRVREEGVLNPFSFERCLDSLLERFQKYACEKVCASFRHRLFLYACRYRSRSASILLVCAYQPGRFV